MALTEDMQLVSVDDHVVEHPRVWLDRLPARHQELGPRIVEATGEERDEFGYGNKISKGRQVWALDGKVYGQIGINAVAGKPSEQLGTDAIRFDEMIPGCYEPKARVADMDVDGVQTGMLFPSFPRFAGTMFLDVRDKDLAQLCTRAWNDFIFEEWCDPYPDRFIPMIILPMWDVGQSIAEIRRLADSGVRAVSFPENPAKLGLPSFHSDHWDPLLHVLEEYDIVLCLHFGTSGQVTLTAPDAPMAVMQTLMGTNSMFAVVDLLFSPVFHRHPKLKVAMSEGGVGWMPWLLERADRTWERHRFYQNVDRTTPPSTLFRKHIWGCFIADQAGVSTRHDVGVDRIMWECDYPHGDSYWPRSRDVVSEMLQQVPDAEAHQIVELNARQLFRFARRP